MVPHTALRSGTEGARGCEVHVARSTDGCRQLVRRLADGFVVLNTFDPLVAQLDRALAEDSVTVAERSTIKVVDTVAGVLSCLGAITGGTPICKSR